MSPVKRSDRPRALPHSRALEEQIRLRAYELYEARGGEDGHELDDWLKAEAEILGAGQRATAA